MPPVAPYEFPSPWRRLGIFMVGGLRNVGFAPATDLLLAESWNGRGLFDCRSATAGQARIARDDADDYARSDDGRVIAGIGLLDGQMIEVSGLDGGLLPDRTADGWRAARDQADSVVLTSPTGEPVVFRDFVTEVRACGFSPTGRTFVVAISSDLIVAVRD